MRLAGSPANYSAPPNNLVPVMQIAHPTFNVKALKNDMGYVVEVRWPDGSSERLAGLYISREHAAEWVNKNGELWINQNQPSFH